MSATTTTPATPVLQPGRADAATHFGSSRCPRCQRDDVGHLSTAHPVCGTCAAELTQEAQRLQERDHLARWLSTRREDARPSRTVRRLLALAEETGVDYRHPPEPRVFAARLAELVAPYRGGHTDGNTTTTTTD